MQYGVGLDPASVTLITGMKLSQQNASMSLQWTWTPGSVWGLSTSTHNPIWLRSVASSSAALCTPRISWFSALAACRTSCKAHWTLKLCTTALKEDETLSTQCLWWSGNFLQNMVWIVVWHRDWEWASLRELKVWNKLNFSRLIPGY